MDKKMAFALFGRALLNSFIIYQQDFPAKQVCRHDFLVEIAEGLVVDYQFRKIQRKRRSKQQIENNEVNFDVRQVRDVDDVRDKIPRHELRKLPKGKKRDCVCDHEGRVRSCYECVQCNVGLCPECYPRYGHKL